MKANHYIQVFKYTYKYGILSIYEIFISIIYRFIPNIFKTKYPIYSAKRLHKQFFKYNSDGSGYYDFNGILIPELPRQYLFGLGTVYIDTFHISCKYNDNYDKINIKEYDKLAEGPYCIPYDEENVLIKKGDVVVDAGAWIGDFAAYAIYKGAKTVYCFDIDEENLHILSMTAKLNPGIIIVPFGLGDEDKYVTIKNSSNAARIDNSYVSSNADVSKISMVTLDSFIKINSINKVDFIKADIEGFERNMLNGARDILKIFAPKLSICTYHLPDDVEVLTKIILEANSNYKIIYRQHKLCAYVPNRDEYLKRKN